MGKLINLTGLSEIRLAPLAANFIEERKGQGLILTTSASRAKRIASDLSFFTNADIKVLPDVESASFRYEAKSTAQLQETIAALAALGGSEKTIVVAPVLGALKKLPPKAVFFADSLVLKNGGSFNRDELIARLARMGYERSAAAEVAGQFAVRGDIVDLFMPGSDDPVRIEFFDTDVDSIRSYDALTQRSKQSLDEIRIWPAQIMVRSEEAFDDTALASAPEGLVVGEVGKGHGLVAQCRVHGHHGGAAGQRENLGMRPARAGQREGHVLDALGYVVAPEVGVDDEAAGSHVLLVLPGLDVAEPGKAAVAGQGNDGLGLLHLLRKVLVCALGDAGSAHFSGLGNGVEDGVYIDLVLGACHKDFNFLFLFHGLSFHVWNEFTQGLNHFLLAHALLDDNKDVVVAGNGAQNLR